MSDFRDPREPMYRDPIDDTVNDPKFRDLRPQGVGPLAALAWIVGLTLVIGVLIFAFGTSDGQRVAGTDTTSPAITERSPAPATPPAAQPPAKTPTAPSQ